MKTALALLFAVTSLLVGTNARGKMIYNAQNHS
jgi:hypothetical protein